MLSVLAEGPRAQVELATATGLSPAAVTSIIRQLTADGTVQTSPGVRSGRRATIVQLTQVPTGTLAGMSLTRTSFQVALWGRNGVDIIDTPWPEMPGSGSQPQRAAARLSELLRGRDKVQAATACLPGWGSSQSPDRTRLVLPAGYPLLDWLPPNATDPLAEACGVPVAVRKDANMAALAEHRLGAGRGSRNLVYAELSEGVGGALVIGGSVFEGDDAMAGEIGHLEGSEHGPRCWCGNRGCLELLIGADALLQPIRNALPAGSEVSLDTLLDGAQRGEELPLRILVEAGRDAGYALVNVVTLLNITQVVVGGRLAEAGDTLLEPLTESLRQHLRMLLRSRLTVSRAELGQTGMLLGCLLNCAQDLELNLSPELKN
ncbi:MULTISPECIES: ROK family transcriptional regulator [unclassified Streptomyces]|uniref:ROK family transcriptional regulator n=1 Tax=unclassified Streptomyces TaxID=2593676 RepID=UPI00344599E7